MKDKEIPVKNVTQKLTERAFPDLFKWKEDLIKSQN
jgi:hypothetical protein